MMSMDTAPNIPAEMIRPPINRAMRVLDRSFFKKKSLCLQQKFWTGSKSLKFELSWVMMY